MKIVSQGQRDDQFHLVVLQQYLMTEDSNRKVLEAIVGDDLLRDCLILRGGGALELFHDGRRIANDLDFVVLNLEGRPGQELLSECKSALNAALNRATSGEAVEREQLRGIIHVDLSLAQGVVQCSPMPVCDTANSTGGARYLKVCTLEEIVAEKLVAILDPGEKPREQDLYDVASVLRIGARRPDVKTVAILAAKKAARRNVAFNAQSYDVTVRQRLAADYSRLRAEVGEAFIPFDDAWHDVVDLVNRLAI